MIHGLQPEIDDLVMGLYGDHFLLVEPPLGPRLGGDAELVGNDCREAFDSVLKLNRLM